LVRKVFGSLSSKEFLSVQPMNLPSGLVFFLDFQYGQDKELNFGPAGDVYSSSASMYGNTNPGAGADPSGGLYGAGRFAYSINQFSASVDYVQATASWADLDYDAELSASVAAGGEFTKLQFLVQLTRPDYKGVRAFVAIFRSTQLSNLQQIYCYHNILKYRWYRYYICILIQVQ
jgi:hypothetical protein